MQRYNFFAVHPGVDMSELAFINITDVGSLHEFSDKWGFESDNKLHAEFGYDLPVHSDGDCNFYENCTLRSIDYKQKKAYVLDMTYSEYVALVSKVAHG